MKIIQAAFFSLLFLISQTGFSQTSAYEPGRFFVKFRKGQSPDLPKEAEAWAAKYGVSRYSRPFHLGYAELDAVWLVEFSRDDLSEAFLKDIRRLPGLDYAERVPRYELFYTPNDLQGTQWNLPQIQAELAWDYTTGDPAVVVAIVDDAVLLSHPDLAGNMWTNTGEIPGNLIDDDNNGYVDDVLGWDAADNDNDPNPPATANANNFSHGTHVAGIAGAVTDNGAGIASIGFDIRLMAVKTKASATSGGSLQAPYQGVQYAIASNADVINMSWGGSAYSATYQLIFDAAYAQGIVCVAAAGNSNTSAPMYPASYNHVISVAATDPGDLKASFSNYGTAVDVSAPGTNIYSTVPGAGQYDYKSGTSMASPLTAGLAGLMLSYSPGLSPDDLEACLKSSADPIDPLNPGYAGQLGAGRINAYEAMRCLKPVNAAWSTNYSTICPGGQVQFTDQSSPAATSWQWSFPGGTPASSTAQNPLVTYAAAGTYNVQLIATNANGSDTLLQTAHITVAQPTAAISGNTTIISGGTGYLTVTFTGNPPYSFTYTDGTSNYTVSGVNGSPYYLALSPLVTTNYSLVSMNDALCAGTVSGSGTITVAQSGGGCSGGTDPLTAVYGGLAEDRGYHVEYTTDGGMIAVGSSASFGATRDAYVVKLDACGIVQWARDVDIQGDDYAAVAVVQTPDGGYGVCGYMAYNGSTTKTFLFKLDASGNLLWNRRIAGGTGSQYPRAMRLSPAGGFIIGGVSTAPTFGANDVYLVETDNLGNILWQKYYGGSANEFLTDLRVVPWGGIVCTGYQRDYAGTWSGFGLKTDASGNMEWMRSYGGAISHHTTAVIPVTGGQYMYAGYVLNGPYGNVDIAVWRADTLGNLIWSRVYGGSQDDRAYDLVEDLAGNFRVIGITESIGAGGLDFYLMEINGSGTMLSGATMGGPQDEMSWGTSVGLSQSAAGNLLFTGSTQSFGAGGHDLIVVRTDQSGVPSCETTAQSLPGQVLNTQLVNFPFAQANANYTSTATNPTVIIPPNQDTLLCNVACSPGAMTTFERTFGKSGAEELYNSQVLRDGNYLISGYTSTGFGSQDFLVAKVDPSGNIIWARNLGDAGVQTGTGVICKEMRNDDLLLVGSTSTLGQLGGVIMRLTPAGSIIWQKSFGGGTNDSARNLIETSDGGIVVVGSEYGNGPGNQDGFVLKMDAAGNQLWSRIMGTSASLPDHLVDVIELPDSNLMVAGHYRSFNAGNFSFYMAKVTTTGTVLWEKVYHGPTGDFALCIEHTPDNGFLLGGTSASYGAGGTDYWLIKTDSNGVFQWSKTYGGAGNESLSCLRQQPNGDIVLAGYTESVGFGGRDALLIRTDASGNMIWAKAYGDGGTQTLPVWGESLANTPDGGLLISGTWTYMGTQQKDGWLIKTDECGNTFCNDMDVNLTVMSVVPASQLTVNTTKVIGPGFVTTTESDAAWTGFLDSTFCANIVPIAACGIEADFLADTVCAGDSTHFTDLSTDSLATVNFWLWYFGDGDSLFNVPNPVHLYPGAGQYTATLIVGNNGAPVCYDTISYTVWVIDSLTLTAGPDSTICMGDSLPLWASPYCGTAPYSYAWSPGAGLSCTNCPNPNAAPAASTTYTVTVTDALGATATAQVNVTVNPACCVSHAHITGDTIVCLGQAANFTEYSTAQTSASYAWNFGAGAVPATFNGQNPPPVMYSQPGSYDVMMILTDACGTDTAWHTVYVVPTPEAFAGNDTTLCAMDSLHLGDSAVTYHSYLWSPATGLSDPNIADPMAWVGSSMTWYLTVTDDVTGCTDTDSIVVTLQSPPTVALPADTSICPGTSFTVNPADTNVVSWLWQDGSTDSTFTVSSGGWIWVEVTNACGTARDSMNVSLNPLPSVTLGADTLICGGGQLLLDPVAVNGSGYLWQDGLTDSTFLVTTTGWYWVQLSNSCGTDTDSIYVDMLAPPTVALPADTTICAGTSFTLNPTDTDVGSYLWQDGSTDSTFTVSSGGWIWVEVTNACGSTRDSMFVTVDPLPSVTLGADSSICAGDVIVLNPTATNATGFLWQDGSTGSTFNATAGGWYWVEVSNNCGTARDSIYLDPQVPPTVELGDSLELCPGETIQLSGTVTNADDYLWNDGSTDSTLLVSTGGWVWLEVSNVCGSARDSVFVTAYPGPQLYIGADTVTCPGEFVTFGATGFASYLWNDGSTAPVRSTDSLGTYILTVWDTNGCSAQDTLVLSEGDCEEILFVPNVFTPNGDGMNDDWYPVESGAVVRLIQVYDRWGKLIFEANSAMYHWDGTFMGRDCPEGVYIYSIRYEKREEHGTLTGTVTLLR